MVDRDSSLERCPRYVLTKAGREQLAERDASHDDQNKCCGRCCGVSDKASETDSDDGDKAHCQGAEDHSSEDAGMPQGHLEMLAGEDPLSDLEADHGNWQRHGDP